MSDQQIKNERKHLIGRMIALRDSVSAIIEEAKALWWQPREYVARPGTVVTLELRNGTRQQCEGDGSVPSGATAYFYFGDDSFIEGTGFYGLPETREPGMAGMSSLFDFQRFIVFDDCAPHFEITQLIAGQSLILGVEAGVTLSKFAESAPVLPINRYVEKGLQITICVRNVSKETQTFSAKIVGREQID